jgi:hypothetical protein
MDHNKIRCEGVAWINLTKDRVQWELTVTVIICRSEVLSAVVMKRELFTVMELHVL